MLLYYITWLGRGPQWDVVPSRRRRPGRAAGFMPAGWFFDIAVEKCGQPPGRQAVLLEETTKSCLLALERS